jgi:site-specific DNA-methyltransferase (adenine-specific)
MSEINIYNEDCLPAMLKIKDKRFDLAIVDPPYGLNDFAQSDRKYYKKINWNDEIPKSEYFCQLKRISQNRIIWGANYFNCFEKSAIVWNKKNPNPDMSKCEIASKSFGKKVDYFEYEWHGYVVKREEPNSFHPCQKPVALYKWLLTNYAKKGDKILDTHLGSGSIAIACHDLGFDLEAYEIDKEYYEAAIKRFDTHKAQLQLQL